MVRNRCSKCKCIGGRGRNARLVRSEVEGQSALAFVHAVEDGAVVDQETGGGGTGGPEAGEHEVVAEAGPLTAVVGSDTCAGRSAAARTVRREFARTSRKGATVVAAKGQSRFG